MNKVTTVNLGGNAYAIEETAYETLRAYLDRALLALADNPDKEEIQKDLERSIGEKCRRFLNPHKSVVTKEDIEAILKEMGPVEGDESHASSQSDTADQSKKEDGVPKRFYNVRDGAMIAGVANGVAAYFNIDVTLVRIIFVLLALITHGGFIGAYILAMIFLPYANTDEQKARAYGVPFTAQELIDNAKRSFEDLKRQKNYWKEEGKKWKQTMEDQHTHHVKKDWSYQYHHNWLTETLWGVFGFACATIAVSFGLWLAYQYNPLAHQFFDFISTHVSGWVMRFDR